MDLCFSHASGTSIIIISGNDLPEINKSSTTISIDAESDFPGKMIGKILFVSFLLIKVELKNEETNSVAISDLTRNPYQPRETFNEAKLEELVNSIKKNGIIQPIAVRLDKSEPGKYEIVAGERRWLAAQKAGLQEVPINILELSDSETLEVAIVENVQREDLNIIEEAKGYERPVSYTHLRAHET